MDKVRGIVTKITYFDDSNGFGIIKIKLDYKDKEMVKFREFLFSNILTILSNFDRRPILDEEFEFIGEFESSSYGMQLHAKSFKRINDQSKEGIITYLSSEYFPGIGKVIAAKVFDVLGKDCLQLITKDRTILDKVDITEKQKETIYENLLINQNNETQLVDLLNLGISLRMATKIIATLGSEAYSTISNNPYHLIDLVSGIGFIRADNIAMGMGITKDNPKRLKALIFFVLNNCLNSEGNTYISGNDLYISAIKLANEESPVLNKDNFLELIDELINEKKIVLDSYKDIFAYDIYNNEYLLARMIKQFLQNKETKYTNNNFDECIATVMENNKIEYNEKQLEAIKKAITEPIVIITGGPGTGKSTIIKGIIDTYVLMFNGSELVRNKIALVAPTGRASKRLKEVTKHDAMTIHRLLGYTGGNRFTVTPEVPLDLNLIIIDEISMVDTNLAAYLFSVLTPTTKVVIVGDADQLPSVSPGNVLQDLVNSKEITTIKLDRIHRQAANSSIVSLAHDINHGMLQEDIFDIKHDRQFIQCHDDNILSQIDKIVTNEMEAGRDLIKDIQVLVPMYKSLVGIDAINHYMQDRFNPNEDEVIHQGKRLRTNDKVIQLVNRSEKQVMNGDIGYVMYIQKSKGVFEDLAVMYDFGVVHYEKDELDDLSLAYAISIHKSQGSEYPVVIMTFSFKYYMMLKRKLIYTGVTRAKECLYLIGTFDAFRKGIVEMEEDRKTKLVDRIKEVLNSANELDKKSDMENISPYDFM